MTYTGATSIQFPASRAVSNAIQNIKQKGQATIFRQNLISGLVTYKDFLKRKSGKNLSGLVLQNPAYSSRNSENAFNNWE